MLACIAGAGAPADWHVRGCGTLRTEELFTEEWRSGFRCSLAPDWLQQPKQYRLAGTADGSRAT
jgi:hypothetical protein